LFGLLCVLLCETTCAGGYVLTGNVTNVSFPREGLTAAYQKSLRYQAASWGLYNWFPGKKRNPLSSEEIVVYGKARRIPQPHEIAGFLSGMPSGFFVPRYEWKGEVTILRENYAITIPAQAVFASNDKIADFYRIECGDAAITLQDVIANYALVEKTPYRFAVCSLPGKDYTVYITAWKDFKPIGKPGDRTASPGPPNSLLDLVTLKHQVFQILDSGGNLAAEYSDFRATLYDTVPESDVDLLFGCIGMLHLIVTIAGNSAY
jgi:hypothetical protein